MSLKPKIEAKTMNDAVVNEDLLARVVLGDRNAFQLLYEETSPKVYGVLLRMLGDASSAQDVLQDTYVRVWSRAGEFHGERGKVLAWIITIARYRALDLLRSQKRRVEVTREFSQDQKFSVDLSESDPRLYSCLETLADTQKSSVVASFVHGFTHEELAVQFAAPIGTIKSRIRRGLQRLKECLEQ